MKRNYKYFKSFMKDLKVLGENSDYIVEVIINTYSMSISVVDGRTDYNRVISECEFPYKLDTDTVVGMIASCIDCDIVIY